MLTQGIDPVLAPIGYGVVFSDGDTVPLLDDGCLRLTLHTYADQLKYIYDSVPPTCHRYNRRSSS